MRVLGHMECGAVVERYDLAVDDRIVALGAVIVGVLDHTSRIGQGSSGFGLFDDLTYVFSQCPIWLVLTNERNAKKNIMCIEILELDPGQIEREQRGVEGDERGAQVAVDPRMSAEQLHVEPRGCIDRVERIG